MKFSIIIPIYNVEKYVEQCLESVDGQSYEDYEIILVNDGSTDASEAICKSFVANSNRNYQIINQANGGLSAARNTGLAAAKGQWIVFVDSDDYISTDLLKTLDAAMAKNGADLYTFNHNRIDANGNFVAKKLYAVENARLTFKSEAEMTKYICDEFLNYSLGWEAWGMIYKRSIIEENSISFQDTKDVFAEDLCFALQYLMHVNSIYVLCDLLYNYRIRPGSLLETVDSKSVLPRIYNLAEYIYTSGTITGSLKKSFPKLYRTMIDFHIKYNLKNFSKEQIEEELRLLESSTKYHRRWYKKDGR